MPKAPLIMDGARGPRQARENTLKSMAPIPEEQAPPGEGVCYFSRYESYVHQITSPRNVIDPYTGRETDYRPVKAKFEGHFFRNEHPDLEIRKLIDTALQSDRKHFGLNKVFWLHEDMVASNRAKYLKDAVAQVKQDPTLFAELEKEVKTRLGIGKSEDLPTPKAD